MYICYCRNTIQQCLCATHFYVVPLYLFLGAIPLNGNGYGSRDPDRGSVIGDIYCSGSEDSLLDCSFDETIFHEFCDYSSDVGVLCQGISPVVSYITHLTVTASVL